MKTKTTIIPGMTGSQFINALNNNITVDDICITVGSSDITNNIFNYGCDGTDDHIQINQAITDASSLTNGGTVLLSSGIFNISESIIIKSNVRLLLTPQTIINLTYEANSYMVINDDFNNGTSNFSIRGGRWLGNRNNQTKNFTGNPEETFWGFGFLFKNASNYDIQDMYCEKSASWFHAHFLSTNAIYRNIEFMQQAEGNGDGITGVGSINLLIENIRGYSGDDMIAVCSASSFFGSLMGNEIIWGTGRDSENITIRNIHFLKSDLNADTYTGIGLYPTEGMKISNVYIENIKGSCNTSLSFIHCINYWPTKEGKGYIYNLNIDNVNVISTKNSQGVIEFSAFDIMVVDKLNINRIVYNNNVDYLQTIIKLSNSVINSNISNITAKNYLGTNKHKLLSVDGSGQNITINIRNVDITSDLDNGIYNTGTSEGLRLNAPDCYTDVISEINNPITGDMLIEKTSKHPIIYDLNNWYDIITGNTI